MKILKYPHPALFTECAPVTVFDDTLKSNLDQMWTLMEESNGMGLSANQVGIMDNYFVMIGPYRERIYCINPVIEWKSAYMVNFQEGCLSAPGEFLDLSRHRAIMIIFQDETGEKNVRVLSDIFAVCAQHEMDHLSGKSFLENPGLDKKLRKGLAKKWGL